MDLNKLSINKLRTELWTCHILSEQRSLRKACEWAEDLLFGLPEEGEEKLLSKLHKDLNDITSDINPQYEHAKTCFELNEYDRAAHLTKNYAKFDERFYDVSRFLHYFSMYKAAEKKRINLMNDVSIYLPRKALLKFNELRDSLERSMDRRAPDGWLLYVHGLVLYKFKLNKLAVETLEKAINLTPINWSAWYILTKLINNQKQLYELSLPNHLFKVFFLHIMHLELDIGLDKSANSLKSDSIISLKESKTFLNKYFKNSLFIKTLIAKSLASQSSYLNPSKYDEAMNVFAQIRLEDPYRVDAMEIYSNLLYVNKLRMELAKLAYDIERIDPFTSEANSCIANSYSSREQQTKAIVYFTRALRLNPDSTNSWLLIGHEYLEVKNFEKAKQAYRYALIINKRDHRAWLGLGNSEETQMSQPSTVKPCYANCLYYYSQVGKYKPGDPRMYQAMASIYDHMGLVNEALVCREKSEPED